jgi:tetratricopeptide (TPR) repeat protein
VYCRPGFTGLAFLLILISCSKRPDNDDSRLVFVPFDYLGSEPALDWVGRAVSGIVAAQTSAATAATLQDAKSRRVSRVVQGYVTGTVGSLHATAVIRDESKQTTVSSIEARGATPLEIASTLARQVTPAAKPYGSNNLEAIREYFSGRPEAAVALDQDFGAAHVSRLELLLRSGRKDELPEAVAAAKAAKLTELDQARLQTLLADTPKAKSEALLRLARVSGDDVQIWGAAAEAALTAKDHQGAIEAFRKVLDTDPDNVVALNTLAYAYGFYGDIAAAERVIEQYRLVRPNDANPLDSLGEIYFYEGRFGDAERLFLQAFELDNGFLGGGALYRAALSRYLLGDSGAADELFRRYLEVRRKQQDPLVPLREAVWLYTTGRKAAARHQASSLDTPAAKAQIALWDLADGRGKARVLQGRADLRGWNLLFERRYPEAVDYWTKAYESSSVVNGNEARMLLTWALSESGRMPEAESLLRKWPLPDAAPEPGLSSIAMAKAIELKVSRR